MKKVSTLILVLVAAITGFSQNSSSSSDIEIIRSDAFTYFEENGKEVRKLSGKVVLKRDSVYMFCDTALVYKESNNVDAFGHVIIRQPDSLEILADTLKYNGNKQLASLYGNVLLTDYTMELRSNELFYNLKKDMAYYFKGAEIQNGETRLNSTKGYYYHTSKDAFFRDNVEVIDPQYLLESDTLKYNIETDVTTFYSATEIRGDGSVIYCNDGWYDLQNDLATFGQGTVIDNYPQKLMADSLYYEQRIGKGTAYKWFKFTDPEKDMEVTGTNAIYYEKSDYLFAYNQPVLVYVLSGDSLYLTADTLETIDDDLTNERAYFGYYNVRMYKSDMQGVCDSLYFSFNDSVLRMFYDPIVWNEESQMMADTIAVELKDHKLDKINLLQNAFITSETEPKYFYDQVKGKYIYGYFKEQELFKMDVVGNAESIYYGKNDEEAYVGANKALATRMRILFAEREVHKITFTGKPEATFHPISKMTDTDKFLEDFTWKIELRPKGREDIMGHLKDRTPFFTK